MPTIVQAVSDHTGCTVLCVKEPAALPQDTDGESRGFPYLVMVATGVKGCWTAMLLSRHSGPLRKCQGPNCTWNTPGRPALSCGLEEYLKRFYPSDAKSRDADGFGARLKEMQKFFRLPVTGMLDSRVIVVMQQPRCGLPDTREDLPSRNRPKWISKVVTYRIISYTRDLPRVTVDHLVAKALNMWSKEIPLSFRRVVLGIPDIVIGFARGGPNVTPTRQAFSLGWLSGLSSGFLKQNVPEAHKHAHRPAAHGDFYPFDGPGGTLAHAYEPGPGLGGDAHFDEDERWADGRGLGINFLAVATHELGHSLGLRHSSDPDSVMYPTYGARDSENFKLSPGDIREIQELYGKRSKSRKK
ncbi:matrilysin isoform X2 [Lynx canadensis]|uniref:matrilysin isoform X2 n=1 Tax=Lynx canadensis TaxID=61383 RepID=UPI0011B06EFD|nr:matrilysin isoform X2 [Lynx canadensis]